MTHEARSELDDKQNCHHGMNTDMGVSESVPSLKKMDSILSCPFRGV